MRDILFRGKDTKGWTYGFYEEICRRDGSKLFIIKPPDTDDEEAYYSVVYPETVGQYTGLTDKNGKKIFEGDIVTIRYLKKTYAVRYDEQNARFIGENGLYTTDRITGHDRSYAVEVIGNVYDNPELIGGKSE